MHIVGESPVDMHLRDKCLHGEKEVEGSIHGSEVVVKVGRPKKEGTIVQMHVNLVIDIKEGV